MIYSIKTPSHAQYSLNNNSYRHSATETSIAKHLSALQSRDKRNITKQTLHSATLRLDGDKTGIFYKSMRALQVPNTKHMPQRCRRSVACSTPQLQSILAAFVTTTKKKSQSVSQRESQEASAHNSCFPQS